MCNRKIHLIIKIILITGIIFFQITLFASNENPSYINYLYGFIDNFNKIINNYNELKNNITWKNNFEYFNFVNLYGKGKIYKNILDKEISKTGNYFLLESIFNNKKCNALIIERYIENQWTIFPDNIYLFNSNINSISKAKSILNSQNITENSYEYRLMSKDIFISLQKFGNKYLDINENINIYLGSRIKSLQLLSNKNIKIEHILIDNKNLNYNIYNYLDKNLIILHLDNFNKYNKNNQNNKNYKNKIFNFKIKFKILKKDAEDVIYFCYFINHYDLLKVIRLSDYEKVDFNKGSYLKINAIIPENTEIVLPFYNKIFLKNNYKHVEYLTDINSSFIGFYIGKYYYKKLMINNIEINLFINDYKKPDKTFLKDFSNIINDILNNFPFIEKIIGSDFIKNSNKFSILLKINSSSFTVLSGGNKMKNIFIYDNYWKDYKNKNTILKQIILHEIMHNFFGYYFNFKYFYLYQIFIEGGADFITKMIYPENLNYSNSNGFNEIRKKYFNKELKLLLNKSKNCNLSPLSSFEKGKHYYYKGAIFYYTMLYRYGIDNFKKIIQKSIKYRFTGLTIDKFKEICENITKSNQDQFFYDFLYNPETPYNKYFNVDKFIDIIYK